MFELLIANPPDVVNVLMSTDGDIGTRYADMGGDLIGILCRDVDY